MVKNYKVEIPPCPISLIYKSLVRRIDSFEQLSLLNLFVCKDLLAIQCAILIVEQTRPKYNMSLVHSRCNMSLEKTKCRIH